MNITTLSADQLIDVIVYQYGIYKGIEKELRRVKNVIKNHPEPHQDEYCERYPSEHGMDTDYFCEKGSMAQLETTHVNLVNEKIKLEKFYKKLIHMCSDIHGDDVTAYALERVDNVRKTIIALENARIKANTHMRDSLSNVIEILNSVASNRKYKSVCNELHDTSLLEDIGNTVTNIQKHYLLTGRKSIIRNAARSYYDTLTEHQRAKIVELAVEVLDVFKLHDVSIDLIQRFEHHITTVIGMDNVYKNI